jgi:3-oxoacyl-(acyl-carrier-protein) synthase
MNQNRTWVLGYGCTSSTGSKTEDFWNALCDGVDQLGPMPTDSWPVPLTFEPKACLWSRSAESSLSVRALLAKQLLQAWNQAAQATGMDEVQKIQNSERVGVIFASTKGMIEDFVWSQTPLDSYSDPYTPILEDFLTSVGLNAKKSLCISNACASSLSALFLAKQWLAQGDVSWVIVLAADHIGPFVAQGFQALRALTATKSRPFDRQRDGLQLGEAAVALVLGSKPVTDRKNFEIEAVGIDTEGFAATRPSLSGESLKRACLQLPALRELPPDLIISHGTSTVVNDQVEDQVFTRLFEGAERLPRVTGTKWCIGHTLGVSGAMDVIAACQVMAKRKFFHLATTSEIDPAFRGRYLMGAQGVKGSRANSSDCPEMVQRILVSSLGFGGVHAAALIRAEGDAR